MTGSATAQRTTWFRRLRTYRWSLRSILLLTSLIAYLVCLARYYPDFIVDGVRGAISCLLIVGIVPRILSKSGTGNDEAATTSWQKALLLGLLVVMMLCGILTILPQLALGTKRWIWSSDEYGRIFYRAASTTWSLTIFLATLACPWMLKVRSRDHRKDLWTGSIHGLVAIACIIILAVIIAYEGLIVTLVVMAIDGVLLGLRSPGTRAAGLPLDSSNRLLDISTIAAGCVGLWILNIVGCVTYLRDVYRTPSNARTLRISSCLCWLFSWIGAAVMIGWIGWQMRDLSPPVADAYAESPIGFWLWMLVPSILVAIYFVTRRPDGWIASATAHELVSLEPSRDFTALSHPSREDRGRANVGVLSAWIGVLLVLLPWDTYKDIVRCFSIQGVDWMGLTQVLDYVLFEPDVRLRCLLALFGLQWLLRRWRWRGEIAPMWPFLNSRQRASLLLAWWTVSLMLLASVPFGILVWLI